MIETFTEEKEEKVYYIGTNDPLDLTTLRRRVLTEFSELPVSGEYMHRDIFDMSRVYGKDILLMVHWLGSDYLPSFFSLKGGLDARLNKIKWLPSNLVDRVMQTLSRLIPEVLPKRMLEFRKATAEEIGSVPGVPLEVAHSIKAHLA